MKVRLAVFAAALVFLTLHAETTSAPVPYTVTEVHFSDLPFGAATDIGGINDQGQVIATWDVWDDINLRWAALLWENGVVTDLGYIEKQYATATAVGINNAGVVVGTTPVGGRNHAYRWTRDGGMVDIGPANDYSSACDINDAGEIIGTTGSGWTGATLWKGTEIIGCGGFANFKAINNNGVIAGIRTPYTGPSSARNYWVSWHVDLGHPEEGWWEWHETALPNLPSCSGSRAVDINDSGQTVGHSYSPGQRAVLWAAGVAVDLGTPEGGASAACAINNSGQVVGYSWAGSGYQGYAAIWDNGVPYDLNDLVLDPGGWFLEEAVDISDLGQIVGRGSLNGESRVYLLTPIPEPATLSLLALGGLVLIRRTRAERG